MLSVRRHYIALILTLVVGVLVQACAPQLSPQQSCNFVMSSDSQRVSWGSQVPVILYVDSSVPPEFYESIRKGIERWNSDLGREVLKLGGWTSAYATERQDGVNVIYWVSGRRWPTDSVNKDKQAITTIYWAADRIFESDIRINNDGFSYSTGELAAGRVDFESLIVHELGHVLGLEHSSAAGTVMAVKLKDNTDRRKPAPIDIQDLKCEY